ncbi:alpha/beta hydrolase [Caulobacter sp. 17J80-11]|uniref:alpha/beta hydrolase n=1 Tax=Caulobacter sp. 17J80-11 TaxID=2763502 RepID=UPI00165375CF|nr:alpha/beta hydrolase [Caulobacter sp. 17J80-11]MBC6982615.1 alpha/beta hydrolase [Caulobacter sp. 17J80-11]
MLDRRTVLGLGAALAPVLAAAPAGARAQGPLYADDPTEIVRLWPGAAPGGEHATATLEIVERSPDPAQYRDRFATGIAEPLMTVFRPARPSGAAVLIIPGGGYKRVVIDKEGFEAARRLNAAGVTAFVLRYRLPADGWAAGPDAPLQDAQRALRIIRADAARYGLDPARVAVLGFSAGGHLAASLAARHAQPVYAAVDARDGVSARPDLAGLMYPVITMAAPHAHPGSREYLLGATPSEERIGAWSRERSVGADTPPTFLVHAADDSAVPVENSLMMFAALRAAKIPSELHVFEEGEHGFGLRLIQGKPAAIWPDLFLAWGARHGVFKAA